MSHFTTSDIASPTKTQKIAETLVLLVGKSQSFPQLAVPWFA